MCVQLVAPDNLESKFRELEGGNNVDDELAAMKAQLGGGSKIRAEVRRRFYLSFPSFFEVFSSD